MALKIRLARGGAKKRPYYRIVVADSRMPRDGRYIEKVGTYNPMLPKDHEDRVRLVADRITHWKNLGALPTDRVERLMAAAGLCEKPVYATQTKKHLPGQKAQERAAEKAEKEAEANAPAEEPAAEAAAE